MKNFLIVILFSLFSQSVYSFTQAKRDKLIGNLIKKALENYHYRNLKINDPISEIGFKEYLKRVDFSKQFLIQSDVKSLNKYKQKMDDQIVSGNHFLISDSMKILDKRIKQVEKWRSGFFNKKIDFTKDEQLELDPEKRKYQKNLKGLKSLWSRIFKHAALNRYLVLVDEQENPPKEDKKSKKKKKAKKKKVKKEKKLSKKELRKKAKDHVSKKYKKFFSRLAGEDHTDHIERFINSLATVFDPHTNYLPPKRKEDFDIDISGSLEGIGAVLQEDGSYIKVVSIVPGGAAWRQKGLEVEDKIIRVKQGDSGEEADLVDMRVDDAVRYIRGKKGTIVILTVKKVDGTKKNIAIERDVVQIGASFAKSSVLEHKDLNLRVGYIHVPKFYRDFDGKGRNCSDDVRKELERLKKAKVDAMILDLRNNGGGALEDARQMSGLFIEKGPIVQIRNHTGKVDTLVDSDPMVTYGGPLIVMINRFSASASEILAGALQDYGRAVIVGGEFSHGKGTVQAVLNLNQGPLTKLFGGDMGALKVTIQKFYRITGASTQRKGVTPDVIIPDPFSYAKNREHDLDNALPWDKIQAKKFTKWPKSNIKISQLIKRSNKRVKKNSRFQKIIKSVKYLEERRDDTVVSLNISKVRAEDKKRKKITEKLKVEKELESLLVSKYEGSLRNTDTIRPGDEKKWKEDLEQRKEDWLKRLRLDVGLEEALFIVNDMYRMEKGKKLLSINSKK